MKVETQKKRQFLSLNFGDVMWKPRIKQLTFSPRNDVWGGTSLRSKRFRLVSEQRKTEERDSRFWPREKWNKSQKLKVGGGGGGGEGGKLLSRLFSGPDWPPLGLRGCSGDKVANSWLAFWPFRIQKDQFIVFSCILLFCLLFWRSRRRHQRF